MTVQRDASGRQTVQDQCPGCLKLTMRRPRTGKARYWHQCPHGFVCPWGDMPNAAHINSYPMVGGCPTCRVEFWKRDRARRGVK